VCLASGPSLTAGDIELVRRWREAPEVEEARGVIAVNSTFESATWADALYAMDKPWWASWLPKIRRLGFHGELWAPITISGVRRVQLPYRIDDCRNSGAGAISLAAHLGARRVIMLGYDCQYAPDGRRHHHPDHEPGKGSGNAGSASMMEWPTHFRNLRRHHPHIEIINCSRSTALTVFPRARLEDVLHGLDSARGAA